MEMKLIDNAMSWKWKASFVASVAWVLPMLSYAYDPHEIKAYPNYVETPHFETGLVFLAIVPVAIWIAARWISLKPEQ